MPSGNPCRRDPDRSEGLRRPALHCCVFSPRPTPWLINLAHITPYTGTHSSAAGRAVVAAALGAAPVVRVVVRNGVNQWCPTPLESAVCALLTPGVDRRQRRRTLF
jgi:hypothetical protein